VGTCKACLTGTFTSSVSASVCSACVEGTFNNASGLTGCALLPGYYNVGGSLVAYYPFNPSTFLADVSGRTGALTNVGDVLSVAAGQGWGSTARNVANFSQPGGLANSNPLAQYLSLPSITLGSAFSVCLWYNPSPTSGFVRLADFTNGRLNDAISMRQETGTSFAFEIWSRGTCLDTADWTQFYSHPAYSGSWKTDTWQHGCLVVEGVSAMFYYNGSLATSRTGQSVSTLSAPMPSSTTFTKAFLGQNSYENELFAGYMDEIRVFGRLLSSWEVAAVYGFADDGSTNALPVPCPAGTFNLLPDASTCTACAAGTYASQTKASGCTRCAFGTHSTIGTAL
jgi:hypothetical protein